MNPSHSNRTMNHRREFLRGCLRCGGLLALGGGASALGWRSLHDHCPRSNPCADCPVFAGCELPKACDSKTIRSVSPVAPGSITPTRSKHV